MKRYRSLIVLGSALLAALLLWILLATAWRNLWLLEMNAQDWSFFAGWAVACLLLLLLAVACVKRFPRSKVAVIIVLVFVIGAMLMAAFAQYVFRADCDYYTFVSPDGQRTVIVREESFLFSSWGTFYQQTSWCTMEKIGEYWLDELYPNGDFAFTWCEDGCKVSFCGEEQVLNWVDSGKVG